MREDCNLDWDNSSRDGKIYLAEFSKVVDGKKKKNREWLQVLPVWAILEKKNCHLLE